MRRRTSTSRSLGAAVTLLAMLAACGSPGASSSPGATTLATPTPVPTPALLAALPKGFPTSFVDQRPTTLPRLSPADGGLRGHAEGSFAADGLTATYTATWIEARVATAKITCGGVAYTGVFTVDDPTVTTDLEFPGWGTGTFVATKRVVVYTSSGNGSSPPVCEEQGGGTFTITFTSGPTPGILTGTWTETKDGKVTLVAAAPASPAPSA